VLYVNSDTNGRGFLFAGGSHSYQHLVNEVAGVVMDPETGASVLDRLRAKVKVDGPGPSGNEADELASRKAAESGGDLPIEALGSGSDYTPFLQHLGISSINLGYGRGGRGAGIYHSTYDSFDHFIRFGDPKFAYGVALAETAGRLVLRAADADVLPMRFGDLADSVERYVSDIEKLADGERENSRKLRQLIDQGAFKLAADPETAYAPPPSPDDVPQFDFSALKRAAERLKKSATNYDDAFEGALASDFRLPPAELAHLNGCFRASSRRSRARRDFPAANGTATCSMRRASTRGMPPRRFLRFASPSSSGAGPRRLIPSIWWRRPSTRPPLGWTRRRRTLRQGSARESRVPGRPRLRPLTADRMARPHWLLSAAFLLAAARLGADPIPVKVAVVVTFEVGQDTGDKPGEFQFWAEREKWGQPVIIPGVDHPVLTDAHGTIGVVSGTTARASNQIMALVLSGKFDFSKTYWVVNGIAGVNPAVASVGSAAWAHYVIDGDVAYEIDSREADPSWPYAIIPIGSKVPNEKPTREGWEPDTMAYELNGPLVDWAYALTKDTRIPTRMR
jgi:hypothetical protein